MAIKPISTSEIREIVQRHDQKVRSLAGLLTLSDHRFAEEIRDLVLRLMKSNAILAHENKHLHVELEKVAKQKRKKVRVKVYARTDNVFPAHPASHD